MSNWFTEFISLFDIFGYSKFITWKNKFNYKTRIVGISCILFFSYILYSLYFQLINFINNPKITRFSYIQNQTNLLPEQTKLLFSQYPIFLEFYAIDSKFNIYNDIDRILEHSIIFKKKKHIEINIKKCSELNLYDYDIKFKKFIGEISGSNLYCLNFVSPNIELLYDDVVIISSNLCKKTEMNNCYDDKILSELKIIVTMTIFNSEPENYNKNPERITPITYTFEENNDGKIYKEITIESYFIQSNEGLVNLSPVYYNLPNSKIGNKLYGNSKIELNIRRSRKNELFERSYETLFDVVAKIGGLLTFLKYIGMVIQSLYQRLYIIDVYNFIFFENDNINNYKEEINYDIIKEERQINEYFNHDNTKKRNYKKLNWKSIFCFLCFNRNRRNDLKNIHFYIKDILSVKRIFLTVLVNENKIIHIMNEMKLNKSNLLHTNYEYPKISKSILDNVNHITN